MNKRSTGVSRNSNITKVINISKKWSDGFKEIITDKKKYNVYKEDFIKEPGTQEKFIWDIFCDYLEKE